MRILLNITPSELKETSGDMSYLRDLLALRVGDLQYETLNDTPTPLRTVRKVFWHLGRWWVPQPLRRSLFIASQRNFVSPSMMAGKMADVFHTHLLLPWNVATLRRRYPIAFSSAGISPPWYYRYIGRGLYEDVVAYYNLVGKMVDVIIVWTNSCARRLMEECPRIQAVVRVVPPFYRTGSSDQPSFPKTNPITRFLFVGKEPIRKGLAETVEAFLHVARVKRDVELIVVSCDVPSQLVEVMSKCSRIRLYNRLVPREEANRLMVESDVIVLPTHAETLGAVLIEGMARGCATLTCDYEPLNEIAPDGVVGFTVPRGDVQALAEKMLILSTERDLLTQMQKNAWHHYQETFSAEAVAPKLLRAYKEAVERHKAVSK